MDRTILAAAGGKRGAFLEADASALDRSSDRVLLGTHRQRRSSAAGPAKGEAAWCYPRGRCLQEQR